MNRTAVGDNNNEERLIVLNHAPDPKTNAKNDGERLGVPNHPTIIFNDNESHLYGLNDDPELQRQYDEMCEGLSNVVQPTVQEILRSRWPTPNSLVSTKT